MWLRARLLVVGFFVLIAQTSYSDQAQAAWSSWSDWQRVKHPSDIELDWRCRVDRVDWYPKDEWECEFRNPYNTRLTVRWEWHGTGGGKYLVTVREGDSYRPAAFFMEKNSTPRLLLHQLSLQTPNRNPEEAKMESSRAPVSPSVPASRPSCEGIDRQKSHHDCRSNCIGKRFRSRKQSCYVRCMRMRRCREFPAEYLPWNQRR